MKKPILLLPCLLLSSLLVFSACGSEVNDTDQDADKDGDADQDGSDTATGGGGGSDGDDAATGGSSSDDRPALWDEAKWDEDVFG